jgi:hypothetical protein
MNILSERAAPQTSSELFGFGGVIALDAQDAVVFDMQAQRAAPPAVKGRGGANDFDIVIGCAGTLIAHFLSPDESTLENWTSRVQSGCLKYDFFLGLSASGFMSKCCAF